MGRPIKYKTEEERKEAKRASSKKYSNTNKVRINKYGKKYREGNLDKEKERKSNYREANKEKVRNQDKLKSNKYRKNNPSKVKIIQKNFHINNPNYNKEYKIKRNLTDPLFVLSNKIRKLIQRSFKNKGINKPSKTSDILGCSFTEFKTYLESKFLPWMTWDNRGKYNGTLNYGWDLDHIEPLSTAIDENDIIRLNHYSNFQPLCGYINRYIKKDNY